MVGFTFSMEFNREYIGKRPCEVARAMDVEGVDNMSQDEYRYAAITAVKNFPEDVGIPKTFDGISNSLFNMAKQSYSESLTHEGVV